MKKPSLGSDIAKKESGNSAHRKEKLQAYAARKQAVLEQKRGMARENVEKAYNEVLHLAKKFDEEINERIRENQKYEQKVNKAVKEMNIEIAQWEKEIKEYQEVAELKLGKTRQPTCAIILGLSFRILIFHLVVWAKSKSTRPKYKRFLRYRK